MSNIIKIQTTRFGDIEINKDDIYYMPMGILGFSSYHRYAVFDHQKNTLIKWMQSVDKPDLAFIIIDPRIIVPDYKINISKKDLEPIKLKNPKDSVVATIIVFPKAPAQITVNLKGPIIFNLKEKLARQIVLMDSDYSVEYKIADNPDPKTTVHLNQSNEVPDAGIIATDQ